MTKIWQCRSFTGALPGLRAEHAQIRKEMRMTMSKVTILLAVMGVTLIAPDTDVVAASATANLPVSVQVASNCTISATAVSFPDYDPIGTHASSPDDSTAGAVTIACTKGTSANIGLGLGANASGSTRRMKDGGSNTINYELYRDTSRTTVWGNASGSWLSPAAAPDKSPRTFTVYGRISSGQDVPAGAYNDTVVATVNF
jgi:spore coat protein U-like protein